MLRLGIFAFLLGSLAREGHASLVTVDKTLAYTRTAGYPLACSCAEGGVSTENCDLFNCTCQCDVTAGACDYNCCCDPDCSAEQKARFSDVGCSAEGYAPSVTQLCYSSLELYKINPHSPLSGQPTAEASVGGALCVEKINAATENMFYTDTGVQSSDIFTVVAGMKTYTYNDAAPLSVTLDNSFDQGDPVAAFSGASTATLYATTSGFMSIPAPDFDGSCNDMNYARFEQDVAARSCRRELPSFLGNTQYAEQCEKDFSVTQYVTELWVGKVATLRASSALTTTDVAGVTINSVVYRNIDTGVETDVTIDFNANACATAYRADDTAFASSGSCAFQTAAGISNVPRCQNMVTSVAYTVTHDSSGVGTITAVVADVIITDLPRDTTAATQSFMQTFSIDFVSTFGGATAQGSGNLVSRSKSGNPGYLMGKPVLTGTLATAVPPATLATIAQTVEGLQVSTSLMPFDAAAPAGFGSATCPGAGESTGLQTVAFGYDMVTGCEMQLTRAELQNACCADSSDCTQLGTSTYVATAGKPYFLALPSVDQYVGLYGNADPLDVSQWVKVSQRLTSANPNWNAQTGVCRNMRTGLHYKFLVATTGEIGFPQSKIVAAEVEEVVSDWHSNVPYTDTLSTQTFPLQITVSFIYKEASDLTGYVPPAPPVLFKVPHDVFYPFFISAASGPASPTWISVVLPVGVCIALLLLAGGAQ